MQNRSATSRTEFEFPTVSLHEAIAKEVASTPNLLADSRAQAWPRSYTDNAVVQKALADGVEPPLPLALYLDGVRYTSNQPGRTDSILGIWGYTLQTHRRHLLTSVRLRDLCKCGCKGWCTLHPLMKSIAWSMKALCSGQRPLHRHDQYADVVDDDLAELSGEHGSELGFRAVVLWLKGDWAEASHSLGLPSVVSKHCPCVFCLSDLAGMHTNYKNLVFPQRPENYDLWCSDREFEVVIDSEVFGRSKSVQIWVLPFSQKRKCNEQCEYANTARRQHTSGHMEDPRKNADIKVENKVWHTENYGKTMKTSHTHDSTRKANHTESKGTKQEHTKQP